MSDAEQTAPLNEQSASHLPLLLEAAPEGSGAQKLDLGSGQILRFDALGPVVVNSNGVRMQRSLSSYPNSRGTEPTLRPCLVFPIGAR